MGKVGSEKPRAALQDKVQEWLLECGLVGRHGSEGMWAEHRLCTSMLYLLNILRMFFLGLPLFLKVLGLQLQPGMQCLLHLFYDLC